MRLSIRIKRDAEGPAHGSALTQRKLSQGNFYVTAAVVTMTGTAGVAISGCLLLLIYKKITGGK